MTYKQFIYSKGQTIRSLCVPTAQRISRKNCAVLSTVDCLTLCRKHWRPFKKMTLEISRDEFRKLDQNNMTYSEIINLTERILTEGEIVMYNYRGEPKLISEAATWQQ